MATTFGNGYGPAEPNCVPSIPQRTQECLDEIRNKKDQPASLLILAGRPEVGKSAYFECITDTVGHSKQETVQFQIDRVEINGKRYYIMDTPGLDTNKEQKVFLEIIRGIEAVRPYATIIGVMLVTRIDSCCTEAVDTKLVDLLKNLCGDGYMSQVTMVTTFWKVSEEQERVKFAERLQSRMQGWRTALGQDLKQYQHGRKYEDGNDTGESLRWHEDHDDIKRTAKMMVSRHYGSIHPQDPRIVQELVAGIPLERTAAGQVLGFTSTHGSHSTSSSTSSSEQTEPVEQPRSSSSQSNSSRTTPNEAPRPFPSTDRMPDQEAYDRMMQNQNRPQDRQQPVQQLDTSWMDFLFEVGKWGFNRFVAPELQRLRRGGTVGGAGVGGGVGGGGHAGFPSWLDPNSPVDHFKARGMPSSLQDRTEWAQKHGILDEPGSAAFGEAVLKAVMREFPL